MKEFMNIKDLIIGQKVCHKFLGMCYYTEQCHTLQLKNPDPTTIFLYIVEQKDIAEVSLHLYRE